MPNYSIGENKRVSLREGKNQKPGVAAREGCNPFPYWSNQAFNSGVRDTNGYACQRGSLPTAPQAPRGSTMPASKLSEIGLLCCFLRAWAALVMADQPGFCLLRRFVLERLVFRRMQEAIFAVLFSASHVFSCSVRDGGQRRWRPCLARTSPGEPKSKRPPISLHRSISRSLAVSLLALFSSHLTSYQL